ncbi:MAG TPA: RNA polymerase sigma-70 factor [Gemmatimonadaceae bacterium]|jgi:RNA polymerase sigma factor, sigma-70 family/RNA polymerase sigma-70 factor, Bacteroides expansion family 1
MASPVPTSPDSELVVRIRRGDEVAFELLFREHYRRLCLLATRMLRSDAAAEELVQDLLLNLWQQRERWEVTGTVAGYLHAAVRNRALNQLRREQLEHQWRERVQRDVLPLRSETPTPDDYLASTELAEAIDEVIGDLPPRCRQAFILRRQQNLSYQEIARIMEIAPKTVEVQIGAALRALRARLAAWL